MMTNRHLYTKYIFNDLTQIEAMEPIQSYIYRERWTPHPDIPDEEMTHGSQAWRGSGSSLDRESVWGSHCFQEKGFALGYSDTFYAVG